MLYVFFPSHSLYLLSQLFIFGLQALAVATPWSVELNQDIFALVVDNGVKVLSHHNLESRNVPHHKLANSKINLHQTYTRGWG